MSNTDEKAKQIWTDRIKSLRDRDGFTQQQVADELGLSLSGYRKLEYGQRDLNIPTLVNLCILYETTPNYILGFDPYDKQVDKMRIDVYSQHNEYLMYQMQYEKLQRTEGEGAAATDMARDLMIRAKSNYDKTLYNYICEFFNSNSADPLNDNILESKYPFKFIQQFDLFDGIIVDLVCSDGTRLERVKYFHGQMGREFAIDKADRYLNKYMKLFRLK